ncbi:MAG: hypothetical protein B7Z76_12590 [Acidiphilium sp. 20-67-58]|nr:MAG: hypothetical protein B7Z76_12590 [Acidiphilium sp. 20-67-58]
MKKKQTNNIKNTNRDESKDEQALPPGGAGDRGGDVAPAASSDEATVRRPVGYLERCDHESIAGWIWDPERPDEPLDIDLVEGGVTLFRVRADLYRPDLEQAGYGNGRHAFSIVGLDMVLPHSRHLVSIRRASDGLDLLGSPHWIVRSPPALDEPARRFMTEAFVQASLAAKAPAELAGGIGLLLRLLNHSLNAHDRLAEAAGMTAAAAREGLVPRAELDGRTGGIIDALGQAYPLLILGPAGAAETAPEVSVIIPAHNHFDHTYRCLESIRDHFPRRSCEIVIVDDGSTDETLFCTLVLAGPVRVVRTPAQLGFVGASNAGAREARGRYLLFLNNDTLVREGWLDALVDTFEQVPGVGIAGSRLLAEDGTLQEVGGIVWRLGDGWNWGRGADPAEPRFLHLRDADWVSGAALMIERVLFQTLGGFDTHYAPAYYEDVDLAFRVRQLGRRVVVQPASEVVHLEGVSNGVDVAGSGLKRYQLVNQRKFQARWKDVLAGHGFNGECPDLEAERQVRRRAYFIDDTVPTPDLDAGSNAAVAHMRALLALGYKVTFVPADNMQDHQPYTGDLRKVGIECLHAPFARSVEEVFRDALVAPDLVYIHRYSNAAKYAMLTRRYFPKTRIVYNVADLHFLRLERQAAVAPGDAATVGLAAQKAGELAVMRVVDAVIVHSSVEAEMLGTLAPEIETHVVPWAVRPRPAPVPFAQRAGIAFVGGFGHPPNVDAVRHYAEDILPLVRESLPAATSHIVGSRMPEAVSRLHGGGLVTVGYVPDLAEVLHRVRCTVAPLRFGAGIKGKVLESFAHGLPCVMSPVAAEGLDLPAPLDWLVAGSAEEFAAKIVRVHEDEALNRRLAEAGLAYIVARYSEVATLAALGRAVDVLAASNAGSGAGAAVGAAPAGPPRQLAARRARTASAVSSPER